MTLKFDHIHLKAKDPDKTAAWYVEAFGFKIGERILRPAGDLFIRCTSTDGTVIVISGEKTGETLPQGNSRNTFGLEHFAIATDDFDGDLARLKSLGTKQLAPESGTPTGIRFTFIEAPDDVRIELMWFPKK